METDFYSNGKLLLTGEYLVLDGASAIAIPTKFGQSLQVRPSEVDGLKWKSIDHNGRVWFEATFDRSLGNGFKNKEEKTLLNILQQAKQLNPEFLASPQNWEVTTKIDFPLDWGLGSSSTLINNIAQWAKVNAFSLLFNSFGGSGYDIAVAQAKTPIRYRLIEGTPEVTEIMLPWNFTEQLFFVHHNRKQDSKEGISAYKKAKLSSNLIDEIDAINSELLRCTDVLGFEALMNAHEAIISEIMKIPTLKSRLFDNYPRTIKSLGAWGGDFALAVGTEQDKSYFRSLGYHTLIDFDAMLK